jgi:hypothetical protein
MPESVGAEDLRDVIEDLVLDAGSITGRYARPS